MFFLRGAMNMKRYFSISFSITVLLLCIFFPEYSSAQQNLEAWHTQGQTFLIWEHSETLPPDTTYDIYTSPDPITSIEDAAWAGRVFARNGSNYRLNDYIPDARWKLPTLSGTTAVGVNQAYFAVTPHESGTSYYAVVLTGLTTVGPENTAGPVEETTDPVTCTIQYTDNIVTIYGHWIDGRADYNSGRPDYPVMGNEYSNGVGENFAEWIPAGGYPAGYLPLNICLHGGMDNLFLSGRLPELYSAALAFVPRGAGSIHPAKNILIGFPDQNLPTNLEGNIGIYDAINWFWRLQNVHQSGDDWPYTIIVSGKNDTLAGWSEKPELYAKLDSAATGFALYWDEREHINWAGAHFRYSEHLNPRYISRFSSDESFPAFSATDTDLGTSGRQPDPGNGDPQNGDPWGTWGGYLEWDTESIEETQNSWAAIMWVVWESSFSCDIPDADTILASVTPRRLQLFQPEPGATYEWCLEMVSGGILQQGTVAAEPSGEITVPDLLLIKDFTKLTVTKNTGIPVEDYENTDPLLRIAPNPFSGSTTIRYSLQSDCRSVLAIYDISGRLVRTLVDGFQPTGNHSVVWNGIDKNGNHVNPGLYFCHLETDNSCIDAENTFIRL